MPYEIKPLYFTGIIIKSDYDVSRVQAILAKANKPLSIDVIPSVFCRGNRRYLLDAFPLAGNIPEIPNHELPDSSSDEDYDNLKPVVTLKRG